MMTAGILARLIPGAVYTASASTPGTGIDAAFPAANLADPQPKVVLQTTALAGAGTAILIVDIDLLADTSIDTIAGLYANLSVAAGKWKAYGANAATGLGATGTESAGQLLLGSVAGYSAFGVAPTTSRTRRHGLLTGAAVTVRYVRVYFQDTYAANPEHLIRLGLVVVGTNAMPTALEKNFELDSARGVNDLSIVEQLDGGEFGIQRKARVPRWQGRWSNLDDSDARAVYALLDEVGESGPVVLVENADAVAGQAEAIHYGLLRDLSLISRPQTNKNAVDVKLVDWL